MSDRRLLEDGGLRLEEDGAFRLLEQQTPLDAQLAVTEASDTLAATAAEIVDARLAAAESDDTILASASEVVNAQLVAAEDADSLQATASLAVIASGGAALPTRTRRAQRRGFTSTPEEPPPPAHRLQLRVAEDGDSVRAQITVTTSTRLRVAEDDDSLDSSVAVLAGMKALQQRRVSTMLLMH